MKKTIILLFIAVGLISLIGKLLFSPKTSLTTPRAVPLEVNKDIALSKTLKIYTDPSGFSFSYPDNLSLINHEATSSATYADIELTAKGLFGSLNLKITDSKAFTPAQTAKETKLGSLKAYELASNNKLVLAAFDQGILFTIESDKDNLWKEVYQKVKEDFAFSSPPVTSSDDSVTFEGEEVVE